jgi:hypothetical protein
MFMFCRSLFVPLSLFFMVIFLSPAIYILSLLPWFVQIRDIRNAVTVEWF